MIEWQVVVVMVNVLDVALSESDDEPVSGLKRVELKLWIWW